MAPMTLRSLERGRSGVTMGAYLAVMQVLGIEKDLDLLAKADPLGRELQDARLRKTTAVLPSEQVRATSHKLQASGPTQTERDWIAKSGFASSDTLAGLIDPLTPLSKKKER